MDTVNTKPRIDFRDTSIYVDWYEEFTKALYDESVRYIFLKGGAGAGKSHLVWQILLQNCMDNYRIWVFRKIRATLRASCLQLFKDLIRDWQVSDIVEAKENLTVNSRSGGLINMFWLDDEEKIKSVAGLDRIRVEEATEISFDEFTQLDLRLRWWTNHKIICTFNPILDTHWLKTEIQDSEAFKSSTVRIEKTARDNKFVGEAYLANLERMKITNPEKYKIYALNLWGQGLKWQIYPSFNVFDYPIVPDYYGLDFWYNDPTALVGVSIMDIDEKKDLFVQELLYERELTAKDLIIRMNNLKIDKSKLIIADSARPEMIEDIKQAWYNIIGVSKPKNSVYEGINKVKEHRIHINWENLYKESSGYCWLEDKKTGKSLDVPAQSDDHLLDAMRYVVWYLNTGKKTAVVVDI